MALEYWRRFSKGKRGKKVSFFEKRSDVKINRRRKSFPVIFPGVVVTFYLSLFLDERHGEFSNPPPPGVAGGHDKRRTTNGRSVRAGTCRCTSAAGDRVTVGTRRRSGRQYEGGGSGGPYAATRHRRFLSADQSRHVRRSFNTVSHRRRPVFLIAAAVVRFFGLFFGRFRDGPKPCAMDENVELPVPELAQQVVQAQHHHVHQHVVVHGVHAGHDTDQRQDDAGVYARRKCPLFHLLT